MPTYDSDAAKAITDVVMKHTLPGGVKDDRPHFIEFFRHEEMGVWPANHIDQNSVEGKALKWKPCHEFDRASGQNRASTPGLPFPFTSRQLAAFMLHGVGALIADYFGSWEDGPLDKRLEFLQEDEYRGAIEEAYAAYRAAESVVGPYDTSHSEKIHELEGLHGLLPDAPEARKLIRQAHIDADDYEADRRKQMVNQLLSVAVVLGEVDKGDASLKPVQRFSAQEAAILAEIRKQGFDPLALPKNAPGKSGVKRSIRDAIGRSGIFAGGTVFNKAWERLTANSEIVITGQSLRVSP